jgi:anti-anti-sigma factor
MTDPVEAPLEMKVKPSVDGGPTVVEVTGDLVATTVPRLRQVIEQTLKASDQDPHIVLDFNHVVHIDTPGLALLYRMNERSHAVGGGLTIVAFPQRFSELIKELHIDRHFRFADTVAAATRLPQ